MADLGGGKYPVTLGEIKETKPMKLLWVEARLKECEAKIAGYKRNILHEEELLKQLINQQNLLNTSIDV